MEDFRPRGLIWSERFLGFLPAVLRPRSALSWFADMIPGRKEVRSVVSCYLKPIDLKNVFSALFHGVVVKRSLCHQHREDWMVRESDLVSEHTHAYLFFLLDTCFHGWPFEDFFQSITFIVNTPHNIKLPLSKTLSYTMKELNNPFSEMS